VRPPFRYGERSFQLIAFFSEPPTAEDLARANRFVPRVSEARGGRLGAANGP